MSAAFNEIEPFCGKFDHLYRGIREIPKLAFVRAEHVSSNTSPDGALAAALKRVLRPVAHLAVARGLTLPSLVRVLKEVLVEVADEEFRVGNRPVTDSRVSVLTGVHRKDVRTIRSEGPQVTGQTKVSILATVVGRWLGDEAFQSSDGSPAPLPRLTRGTGRSFASLVESVATDIRPRTVLDALLTRGVVELDEATDDVTIVGGAFVPDDDDDALLAFFASNVHDHIAAASHNLMTESGDPKFLEQAVFYSGLSEASIAELEADIRASSREQLLRINAMARDKQSAESDHPEANKRFRFGVYFYTEDENELPKPSPKDEGR